MNADAIWGDFCIGSLTVENRDVEVEVGLSKYLPEGVKRGGGVPIYPTRNVFKTQIFEQELERGK